MGSALNYTVHALHAVHALQEAVRARNEALAALVEEATRRPPRGSEPSLRLIGLSRQATLVGTAGEYGHGVSNGGSRGAAEGGADSTGGGSGAAAVGNRAA